MIEIRLSQIPVPKSNRYIRTKGGRVFKHPRVRNWETKAVWEIRNQYKGEPLEYKLSVDIELILPNNRKRDIDNMLKSLWDILERAGVIKNDNQIYRIKTVKRVDKGQEGVIIKLTRFRERKGSS